MANLLDEVLPQFGFQNTFNNMMQGSGLLESIPFVEAVFAASLWYKGFIDNSLGKLGILSFLFKVKSPVQGTNFGPLIGGLPALLGGSQSRQGK